VHNKLFSAVLQLHYLHWSNVYWSVLCYMFNLGSAAIASECLMHVCTTTIVHINVTIWH